MKKYLALTAATLTLSAVLATAGDGAELYAKNCAKCHGTEGKGDTKMGQKLGAKDLTDAKRQAELKDETIAKAIKEGVKQDGKVVMKASEDLSDQDIKDLVAQVRKLKK